MTDNKSLVGICCDTKLDGVHIYHLAGHKYVNAVAQCANAIPLMMPSLATDIDWEQLLSQLDGILLTGSYSNIQPHLYGLEHVSAGSYIDQLRDATVMPLIPKIIAAGIPLLAICRGFQELNVAYGGTLHRLLHEVGSFIEHREDKSLSVDEQYAVSHPVNIHKGGILEQISGGSTTEMVNSIHMQGVDRLGDGLVIEATAEDGLIEALSVRDARAFTLAVQWHPEWKTSEHPFYQQIFTAFSAACQERRKNRLG